MKQGSNKIYYLVAGLCMYVFFLATTVASAASSDWYYRAEDVSINPQVAGGEVFDGWQAVGHPYDLPVDQEAGSAIWLRHDFSAEDAQAIQYDPALFFSTTDQSFEIYLDGKQIYAYGDMAEGSRSRGMMWHLVHLPMDFGGKSIYIHLASDYHDNLGSLDRFALGEGADHMRKLIQRDCLYIIPLPITFFMIFLMLCFLFISRKQLRFTWYCIVFFILFFIWTIAASDIKMLFVHDAAFWWNLLLISIYLMALFLNLIVYEIIEPCFKNKMKWIVIYYALYVVYVFGGQLIGYQTMRTSLTFFYLSGTILQAIVVYMVGQSAWQGNEDCRAFFVALVSIPLLAVYDVLGSHFRIVPWFAHMTVFGVIGFAFFVLRVFVIKIRREQQLQDEVERTREISFIDPLTKCYNRKKLEQISQRVFSDLGRSDKGISLLFLDIDHFKAINDAFGHDVGDKVLEDFANIVRMCLRHDDTFVRYGGEEFLVLCANTDRAGAKMIAERIRSEVEQHPFMNGLQLTCSIGISGWQQGVQETIDSFIKRADLAVYRAKANGRNRVEVED